MKREILARLTHRVRPNGEEVQPAPPPVPVPVGAPVGVAESLGFPPCSQARSGADSGHQAPLDLESLRSDAVSEAPGFAARDGVCAATVCTRNHIHFARALVRSFREHHPGAAAFVLVVDGREDGEALEVEGATVLAGRGIVGPRFDFLALKYSAVDLCCALKPYLLNHLVERTGFRKIVYLDADLYLFAPLEKLLGLLDRHTFVVTPHTLAPLPNPERFWERPSLGDLAYSGTLNAGLFGFHATAEAHAFLATWQELVTAPGAFLADLGGQMEQNSFNWITCFTDGVHVLRDPAYNVAYWNFHDRSLRHRGLDCSGAEEGAQTWTVDGEPLVAYHFSGFSLDAPYKVSKHDHRHSLYLLPSVSRLFDFYAARLREHGGEEARRWAYPHDRFPSGIEIDARMRYLFKVHEAFLGSGIDPWTPEGEAHFCEALLSPIPYTGSLLPILFQHIYIDRPDLRQAFPDAHLRPDGLMRWIASRGIYEYGYQEIFNRYRPALPTHHGVSLLSTLQRESPKLLEGLAQPLSADRERLIERLDGSGRGEEANAVRTGEVEHYYVSPIRLIRKILEERPDVRRAFPDLLDADAPAFAQWLEHHGVPDHFLPPHAPAVFLAKAQGRALARIFSYLSRNWSFMESWPLGLVGEGSEALAATMMTVLRHGMEYDLDDLLLFLWLMEERPWAGLPLTFELGVNACRVPSPLLPEGQEQLLQPLLARDPRFQKALASYRKERREPWREAEEELIRRRDEASRSAAVSVYQALGRNALPALVPGVNFFGYHKSPIGLGNLTRGLRTAIETAGIPVRPNVLGNVAMDADLSPADFVRTFDAALDTNLFASYPHIHDRLLETLPKHRVEGRRNIAYLAWEQRDGSHYWEETYQGFDQIWALSEFAAECFRRFMKREVLAVPCVLDFAAFPAAASKEELGLDPGKLTFLYVFDANSSIERKNPEAALRAFGQAFSPGEPVKLLLRASNAHRLDHRERLRRVLRSAPPGLDIELVTGDLPYREILRLLSAVDCYVSLHRAEGFGYTCAEAMSYGRPVIASGYSGNLQFMNAENSFLVDCAEREVEVADGPFQRGSIWGDPSVEHAAHLLRTVYLEREQAREIGERGRRDVRATLSAEAVGRIVGCALKCRAAG